MILTDSNFEEYSLFCRFLNRTATHPVLLADQDFKEFLEKDSDLPRATSTSALSGAGVMRLFHKVGDTFEKIAFKMDENDEVGISCSVFLLYLSVFCRYNPVSRS